MMMLMLKLSRKTLADLEMDGSTPRREEVVTPLSLPQPLALETKKEQSLETKES